MTDPPVPVDVERLAIICPSWVGDTVMATPVLRAARQARPAARIIAVCRPGLDRLLAGLPWMDEVIAFESKRLGGTVQVLRALRHARVTAAILLPNSFRWALIARLAGIRVRVGYRRSARGPLLSHALTAPKQRAPVAALGYYARLAGFALGVEAIDMRMELIATDEQHAEARAILDGVPRPFAVLCPGGNKPAKRWPAARYARVAEALARRYGLSAVATGSPGERSIVAAVKAAAGTRVVDLTDRGMSLGTLKGVIAEARIVITNDTGPRHVAAALGTPVVSLFGPTDPRWTSIEFPLEKVLTAEPFLPAELTADDHAARCAIERITVADVLAAAGQLLDAVGPESPSSRGAAPGTMPPDSAGTP